MEDLSLHILDVAENATTAGATLIEINITEDRKNDILSLSIKDNGHGMDREMTGKIRDPFVTTRSTRRVGLGISLLEQSAIEAEGNLMIESEPGRGTEITATFRNTHIDRKPLGDIASTIITLIVGNPEIDIVYMSNLNGIITELDTREIKMEIGDIGITNSEVLKAIKSLFKKQK
ncbi:MAG: ATP-binding protein [Spirochaetes bacterium]|nr:ATP-binding protein [Spirochaetota bacterium]